MLAAQAAADRAWGDAEADISAACAAIRALSVSAELETRGVDVRIAPEVLRAVREVVDGVVRAVPLAPAAAAPRRAPDPATRPPPAAGTAAVPTQAVVDAALAFGLVRCEVLRAWDESPGSSSWGDSAGAPAARGSRRAGRRHGTPPALHARVASLALDVRRCAVSLRGGGVRAELGATAAVSLWDPRSASWAPLLSPLTERLRVDQPHHAVSLRLGHVRAAASPTAVAHAARAVLGATHARIVRGTDAAASEARAAVAAAGNRALGAPPPPTPPAPFVRDATAWDTPRFVNDTPWDITVDVVGAVDATGAELESSAPVAARLGTGDSVALRATQWLGLLRPRAGTSATGGAEPAAAAARGRWAMPLGPPDPLVRLLLRDPVTG